VQLKMKSTNSTMNCTLTSTANQSTTICTNKTTKKYKNIKRNRNSTKAIQHGSRSTSRMEFPEIFPNFPRQCRKILPNCLGRDDCGFRQCFVAIMIYKCMRKHFQFKSNKINNRNSIQIIQNS